MRWCGLYDGFGIINCMKKFIDFFKRPAVYSFCAYTLLFAICSIVIFWGTWSLDKAAIEPDQPITYPVDFIARRIVDICGGMPFVIGDLRYLFGGPYFWQELQYAFACFLAGLGVAFYLRGKKLSCIASYGGALFYGFCGYSFSLYSAGHLGWFIFLMYGPFAFGLVDRAVRKNKIANWILLGGVLAWGSLQQPDLWLLFTVFTFAYGFWRTVQEVSARGGKAFSKILIGVIITAVVTAAVGMPQFMKAFNESLKGREAQIKESAMPTSGAKSADAETQQKWNFVTGWSMPPEEVLEFIAPHVRGDSSDMRVSPETPYWGRLGRVPDEHFIPGRMMPNYRQHSLYLGAITVAFAIIGMFLISFGKKDDTDNEIENRSDIPFWIGAAVLFFVCSLGRFTPFYKLVFSLPFGDYLRAPVKYHHLVEFCVAVLAGFGIDAIVKGYVKDKARIKAASFVVGSIAVLLFVLWMATDQTALSASISKLGFPMAMAKSSAANYAVACVRGGLLVSMVLGTAVFFMMKDVRAVFRNAIVCGIILIGVIDLTEVNSSFLGVEDVSFERADNDVAKQVKSLGGGTVFVNMLPQEGAGKIASAIGLHGVKTSDKPANDVRFVLASGQTFQRDKTITEKLKSSEWKNVGMYSVSQKGGIKQASGNNAGLILMQVASVPSPKDEVPKKDTLAQILALISVISTFTVAGVGIKKSFSKQK